MSATVLDTGPIVAALNAGDRRHGECTSLLTSLSGRRPLPSPVLTEVCWLLERWPKVEAAFLAQVAQGTFELVHLTPVDLTRMSELVLQYADFPLGAVDASVVAVADGRVHRSSGRCGAPLAVSQPVVEILTGGVFFLEPL